MRMTKMLNLILEDEDWITRLKYRLDEGIHFTDQHNNPIIVTFRVVIDNGLIRCFYHILIDLKNELEIPVDILKATLDHFVEISDEIIPPDDRYHVTLKLQSFYYKIFNNTLDTNYTLPPIHLYDIYEPGYTDNLIIHDGFIKFEDNLKENIEKKKNRVGKIYQGLKKGSFRGTRYTLPDNYKMSFNVSHPHPSEIDTVTSNLFEFSVTILIPEIKVENGDVDLQLVKHIKDKFNQFDILTNFHNG